MNVTALIDGDPTSQTFRNVLERYRYDPYGHVTVMDGSWNSRSASSYDNHVLFAGYYRDTETGLYHVRNRMYHPRVGAWLQRDPAGYADGMSLYQYCGSMATGATDPMGLGWMQVRYVSGYPGQATTGKDKPPQPKQPGAGPEPADPGNNGKWDPTGGKKPGPVSTTSGDFFDWHDYPGLPGEDEGWGEGFGDTFRGYEQWRQKPELDALDMAEKIGGGSPYIDYRRQEIGQQIDATGVYGENAPKRARKVAAETIAGAVVVTGGAVAIEVGVVGAAVIAGNAAWTAAGAKLTAAGTAITAAAIKLANSPAGQRLSNTFAPAVREVSQFGRDVQGLAAEAYYSPTVAQQLPRAIEFVNGIGPTAPGTTPELLGATAAEYGPQVVDYIKQQSAAPHREEAPQP